MSSLFSVSINNFIKNPKKIFYHGFSSKLNGHDCEKNLKKISSFLRKNKVNSIGICCKNNINWPLWYLASNQFCKDIYILNPNYPKRIINKIQKRYKINLIIYKMDHKKIVSEKLKILRFKNHFIKNKTKNNILFTSGTSDIPKGVIINNFAYTYVANFLIKSLKQNKNDIELLSMPFNHSFGITRLRCVLLSGSSALITDGLKNFPYIYSFTKKIKLTGLSMVPSGIEIIKNLLKKKASLFSKNIKYFEIGSSSLSTDLRYWLKKNFKKTKILHHYGTTEASRSFIRLRGKDDNLNISNNWIGKNMSKVKYKIINNELLVKGKNLFSGYLESGDHKKFSGWFNTGDNCEVKNDRVFIKGRIDNQLNVGGQKIQAEFLENLIEKDPKIRECLCFQKKDKVLINKIVCLLHMKKNQNSENLKKSVLKSLNSYPSYYQPSEIKIEKNIPKTLNGKKIRDLKILNKY